MASDKTFWIRIKSLFERGGADEARQSLEDTSQAADDAGGSLDQAGQSAEGASGGLGELGRGAEEASAGLDQAADSARDAGDAAQEAGEGAESSDLPGFFGRAKEQLTELGNQIPILGQLGGAITGLAKGPVGLLIAAFGVATAGIKAATKAIGEFAGHQTSVLRVNAALASTGTFSRAAAAEVQELAGEMQKLTGVGDTEWIDVMRQLLQMGADQGQLREHVKSVADLAGLIGDVNTASLLYSRALQGQFQMLSRYGIELERTGDKVKDLENFQRILAERGGGQLEASMEGLEGRFKDLTNTISDVWKGLGNLISSSRIVETSFSVVTRALEGVVAILPTFTKNVGELENASTSAAAAIDEARNNLEALAAEKLDGAIAEAKALRDELDGIADAATRARQRKDELADAETAVALAGLDAEEAGALRGAGDDSHARAEIQRDFAARRQQVREQAAAEKRERERVELEERKRREAKEAEFAQADAAAARERRSQAGLDVGISEGVVRRNERRRKELQEERGAVGEDIESGRSAIAGFDPSAATNEEARQKREELEQMREAVAAAEERQKQIDQEMRSLDAQAEAARARLQEDAEAVAAATAEYEKQTAVARTAAAALEEVEHRLKLLEVQAKETAASGEAETIGRADASDQAERARQQREREERLAAERERTAAGAREISERADFGDHRREKERDAAGKVREAAKEFGRSDEGSDVLIEALQHLGDTVAQSGQGNARKWREMATAVERQARRIEQLEGEIRRNR